MEEITHQSVEALNAGLDVVKQSPSDLGVLDLIVRRPELLTRESLETGQLNIVQGLVGDSWIARPSKRTDDGSPHPDMQLTIINTRLISLVAQQKNRWQLAGDQLYIDMDLSNRNLPAGTRLSLGKAIIEITDQPHTGCAKFTERFGLNALKFINSPEGKSLRLRGIYAKTVQSGKISVGDVAVKL